MPPTRRLAPLVILAVAACQGPGTTATPKPGATARAAIASPRADLAGKATGRVLLPATLISDRGGAVLANNGGGVVANNGGRLVANNGAGLVRQLAGLPTGTVAGVAIALADGAGKPLAGAATATTDAAGRFSLAVPRREGPVVVSATFKAPDGRTGVLRARGTLVDGAVALDLTLASTFVWVAVAGGAQDGPYDAAAQERAIAATDARLTEADAAAVFDEAAIRKLMDALATKVADLRVDLGALDARFRALEQKLDDLGKKVETLLSPSPSAPPSPLPQAPAVAVTTLAGSAETGFANGLAAAATFGALVAVVPGPAGAFYFTDHANAAVRRLSADGVVSTVAGGSDGNADGVGAAAAFLTPLGLAVDAAGVLYVADWNNTAIRRIAVDAAGVGTVTTLAGGTEGFADGAGAAARFRQPHDVVALPGGGLAVVDQGNHAIRKIDAAGVVTTWAGTGAAGYLDGPGAKAQFKDPVTAAVAADGSLYVNDRGNSRLRRVAPDGTVTTVAGDGQAGDVDGYGAAARLNDTEGLTVDGQGRLLIADAGNNKVRRYDPATGAVITLAGTGAGDFLDGDGATARFNRPSGIAVAADGSLVIADGSTRLRRLTYK